VALQNRYKDRLQIIGLVVDDDDEKGIRQSDRFEGINYPVALTDSATRFAYAACRASNRVCKSTPMAASSKNTSAVSIRSLRNGSARFARLPVAAKVETFQDEATFFEARRPRQILPAWT